MITRIEKGGEHMEVPDVTKVTVAVEPGTQVIIEKNAAAQAVYLIMDYGEEGTDVIDSWKMGAV